MRDKDLFQLALGLSPPWFVASTEFDADKKRLDIRLDFKAGARFGCPDCKAADCPVHDTTEKTWRHLDPGSALACRPGHVSSSIRHF